MKLLLILGILFPLTSFAAIGTRGGGNARVCFTNEAAATAARIKPLDRNAYWSSIASIEVLDLYEAKLPRGEEGISPIIMDTKEGESAKSFVERVAKRFDGTFPSFANVIRRGRDGFNQSQIIWSAEAFGKTDDIDPALHFENKLCSILGLAFQKEINGQEKLFIDQQLFQHPKHSLLSRNITFLHEFIYRYARTFRNHETSAPTREAVGLAIAILPSNVDKDKAEEWGLSIGAISQTLMSSDLIATDRRFDIDDYRDAADLNMVQALEVEKDFVNFQILLANREEAQTLIENIHELIFVKAGYNNTNGPLLGLEKGVCRKDFATIKNQILLGACLTVTANENDEFIQDPSLKNELSKLDTKLRTFLDVQAPLIAKENILPLIFKDVEARFTKLNIEKNDIQKYESLLADELLKNIKISFDVNRYYSLTSVISKNFTRTYLREVIESINKRTADAPTK